MLELKQVLDQSQATARAVSDALRAFADKSGEYDARIKEVEQRLVRRPTGGGFDTPPTLGKSLIDSEEFKSLAVRKKGFARIEVKTTITSSQSSGGSLVPTDHRTDPIMLPRRKLRIRNLLSQSPTESNAVKFVRQTGFTNAARIVSEGMLKPESAIAFEADTANIATIAHWQPASKQILDDAPALMALIDQQLVWGADYAEEQQILLGDGTGENFLGLIPQSSAFVAPFSVEFPQRIDAILQAVAQLQALEFEPNGVVLNSIDWSRIRSTKDQNGVYVAGGPMSGAPRQLWELPVVSSNSIPAGHFLVGDFLRAATIYDRQTTTVEVSTEHSDFFTRNLLAVRAEKRVGLAVQVPECLIYGAFQTTT